MDLVKKIQKVRVPVQYVNGHWEFVHGGEVPVSNNTIGDLELDQASIRDETFLQKLTLKTRHKALDHGVRLLVALTIKDRPELPETLKQYLRPAPEVTLLGLGHRWSTTDCVEIKVGEHLEGGKAYGDEDGSIWLCVEGFEATGLITTGEVFVPLEVSESPLSSLNHAFTRLSEAYEPWRISHTGNIYDRILYQEANGRWHPLGDLREPQLAKAERPIAAALWKRVVDSIGIPGYDPTRSQKT